MCVKQKQICLIKVQVSFSSFSLPPPQSAATFLAAALCTGSSLSSRSRRANGVSFMEQVDVKNGEITSDELHNRLEMLQHDIQVYGHLLANQRANDLTGTAPGFMAQLRK